MKTMMETGVGVIRMGRVGIGLAIAALTIAGAVPVLAQGPGGGEGRDLSMGPHRPPMEREVGPRGEHARWWNDPRAVDKLKLTDTQRKAMDDIYQQHRLTLVDLHGTLEKAELSLEPLISADQPDEGKILAQIDRVAQARAELEKANARLLLGIRRQLTPEQWKQLQTDRASRRDGHFEGHERGGREQEGAGGEDGHRWHGPGGSGSGWQKPGGAGSNGTGSNGAGPAAGTPPPPGGPGENE